MRIVRGSVNDVTRDRTVTTNLLTLTSEIQEPVVRVWTPPKQIAFGRRDTTADGYDHAREIAIEHGYEPIERDVGGSAVAYTGRTVAFAFATPTSGGRGGIDRRYRDASDSLASGLRQTGATVTHGEPAQSFCPGEHSLCGAGKIAGIAQRIRQNSVLVGGCVIVLSSDVTAISEILDPIYSALAIPFDPDSVGSVSAAGGPDRLRPVLDAIEETFTTDSDPDIVPAAELTETDMS